MKWHTEEKNNVAIHISFAPWTALNPRPILMYPSPQLNALGLRLDGGMTAPTDSSQKHDIHHQKTHPFLETILHQPASPPYTMLR